MIGGEIAHTWQNCDFRLQSRDVSGSYAEPGTKTLRTDRNRGQIIAECRGRHHPLIIALAWTCSIRAILAIAALIAGNIHLHRASPRLKAKVVETLSTRFDSRVELDQFHATFNDGFRSPATDSNSTPTTSTATSP